ncbi:MAG: glycine C-acetyltransferase [Candidatus Aenigmarchaeota archaeon]|nr:glycine C-acetyltransferase [Candidatus Aenigmarchaeota archaeon]
MHGKNHLEFLKEEVESLKKQNLFNALPVLESEQQARVRLNGKDVITLSTNNYLGFANHPRLRKAAIEAIHKWGFGTGAVRQIAGTMKIHMDFEEQLARYKRTEAALVFTAGIAANRGTIQCLFDEGDVIISDELNHGSIIDGVRLTKAGRKIYPHKNTDELKKILSESNGFRRRLVVTDGVFSMDGDTAPLDQIAELCQQYDAILMVDDAHGDGVMGKDGRGTASHYKVDGLVDIDMGTLSKAFGCLGGYIAGVQELKDYLTNRARTFIFTTAHPPAVVAACTEAIRMVQDEPQHLQNLWKNTKHFKQGLIDLGFNTGNSETPITPVIVGESSLAQQLSAELFKEGIFVKPIVYPLVAKDKARVRTIVTAQHTKEDLDTALEAFGKVGARLKIISQQ